MGQMLLTHVGVVPFWYPCGVGEGLMVGRVIFECVVVFTWVSLKHQCCGGKVFLLVLKCVGFNSQGQPWGEVGIYPRNQLI